MRLAHSSTAPHGMHAHVSGQQRHRIAPHHVVLPRRAFPTWQSRAGKDSDENLRLIFGDPARVRRSQLDERAKQQAGPCAQNACLCCGRIACDQDMSEALSKCGKCGPLSWRTRPVM